MNQALALELFGYLGSFLVLISMLMTSVVRLRVINLIGSAIFAAYAILIRSYPTALLNGCLVLINLYHLLRLRQNSGLGNSYEFQPLGSGEGLTAWFLRKYGEDIRHYFLLRISNRRKMPKALPFFMIIRLPAFFWAKGKKTILKYCWIIQHLPTATALWVTISIVNSPPAEFPVFSAMQITPNI